MGKHPAAEPFRTRSKILGAVALLVALLLWRGNSPGGGPAELTIDSQPQGAPVYLDGAYRGVTPLTLAPVDPGPHDLRVKETVQHLVLQPGDRQFLRL